jgi:hypothetical protein
MKRLIVLAAFAVTLLVPVLAFGQPCPPVNVNLSVADQAQEWWMVLLDFLVQLSAPLITGILGVLGTWLVRKLAKKWDTEKQEATVRLTQNMIQAGVAFAEEQARKALRADRVKTESADKMQSAVDFVQQQLDASGLPNIAQAELMKLIEARLHAERARPDGVVPSEPADSVPGPEPEPSES